MAHFGIKNVSGEKTKQKCGGLQYDFDKDEVKIVDAPTAQFFQGDGCMTVISDGKLLQRKKRFALIPLAQALKVAKEPEDPSIAKAKAELVQEEKHKGELRAEILKTLREEGWSAPAAKK